MTRSPRTPDCGIRGCTRAEYRMGVCRHHAHLVPREASLNLMAAVMTTSHRIGQTHRRRAVREAQRVLDAQS